MIVVYYWLALSLGFVLGAWWAGRRVSTVVVWLETTPKLGIGSQLTGRN